MSSFYYVTENMKNQLFFHLGKEEKHEQKTRVLDCKDGTYRRDRADHEM